jgi:DNA transposition AAA+ family ATPase
MNKEKTMNTTFHEDQLPEGQSPILTSNIERLKAFTQLLTDPESPYSTMGIVTAPSGSGKTIAAQVCQEALERRFHSALPVSLKIKVMPRSTPRALATNIVTGLGEQTKGRNIYELAEAAAEAIHRNDLRLIFFDEGDRLNADSFEVIRYLLDKTGCPMLIVGLPSILTVIEQHEKFSSRAGLRMSFKPLGLDEILSKVLPQLVFSRWSFDPNKKEDQEMGEWLWKKVQPSLRKLRNVLATANVTAKTKKAPTITLPILQEAFTWIVSQDELDRKNKRKTQGRGQGQGSHEQQSEQRNASQEKKDTDANT